MNYPIALLVIWMQLCLGYSNGAPLVSSVHVRFISGNQATQYGHGSLADGTSLHYNTVDIGPTSRHLQRRSLSTTPPKTTFPLTYPLTQTRRIKRRTTLESERPNLSFVPAASRKVIDPIEIDPLRTDNGKTEQRKGGVPVKRSPLTRTFGFFPDFDDYRGNDFRSPFPGRHRHQNLIANAESLAPGGLFLPPISTAGTNAVGDDSYAADPESVKYAAQHPPYFHEYPHKRAVTYLNEERIDNGLEPNILRSIRPFFPFFEINK